MYLLAKRIRNERPIWSMLRFDFVYLNMCCTCVAPLLYFSFFLFFFLFCLLAVGCVYRNADSRPTMQFSLLSMYFISNERCMLYAVCPMLNAQFTVSHFTCGDAMRMICFRLVCNLSIEQSPYSESRCSLWKIDQNTSMGGFFLMVFLFWSPCAVCTRS